MKKAIQEEIMGYHKKPKSRLTNFDLKPVPKDELLKAVPKGQLVKPVEVVKPLAATLKPIRGTLSPVSEKSPGKTCANASLDVFIQQQETLPPPPQTPTGLNVFLHEQQLKTLQQQLQGTLSKAASDSVQPRDSVFKKPAPGGTSGVPLGGTTKVKAEPGITVDASSPILSDVEMLSAQSARSQSMQQDEKTPVLAVQTTSKDTPSSLNDVVMLSAKTEPPSILSQPTTTIPKMEDKPMDTKARIKEAILKAGLRKQQHGEKIKNKFRNIVYSECYISVYMHLSVLKQDYICIYINIAGFPLAIYIS